MEAPSLGFLLDQQEKENEDKVSTTRKRKKTVTFASGELMDDPIEGFSSQESQQQTEQHLLCAVGVPHGMRNLWVCNSHAVSDSVLKRIFGTQEVYIAACEWRADHTLKCAKYVYRDFTFSCGDGKSPLEEEGEEIVLRCVDWCEELLRRSKVVVIQCSTGVDASNLVACMLLNRMLPSKRFQEIISSMRTAKRKICSTWETLQSDGLKEYLMHREFVDAQAAAGGSGDAAGAGGAPKSTVRRTGAGAEGGGAAEGPFRTAADIWKASLKEQHRKRIKTREDEEKRGVAATPVPLHHTPGLQTPWGN